MAGETSLVGADTGKAPVNEPNLPFYSKTGEIPKDAPMVNMYDLNGNIVKIPLTKGVVLHVVQIKLGDDDRPVKDPVTGKFIPVLVKDKDGTLLPVSGMADLDKLTDPKQNTYPFIIADDKNAKTGGVEAGSLEDGQNAFVRFKDGDQTVVLYEKGGGRYRGEKTINKTGVGLDKATDVYDKNRNPRTAYALVPEAKPPAPVPTPVVTPPAPPPPPPPKDIIPAAKGGVLFASGKFEIDRVKNAAVFKQLDDVIAYLKKHPTARVVFNFESQADGQPPSPPLKTKLNNHGVAPTNLGLAQIRAEAIAAEIKNILKDLPPAIRSRITYNPPKVDAPPSSPKPNQAARFSRFSATIVPDEKPAPAQTNLNPTPKSKAAALSSTVTR